mgnify:CR=1 FL=1
MRMRTGSNRNSIRPVTSLVLVPLLLCSCASQGSGLLSVERDSSAVDLLLAQHGDCLGVLLTSILGFESGTITAIPMETLQAIAIEESEEGMVPNVTLDETSRYFQRSNPLADPCAVRDCIAHAFDDPSGAKWLLENICVKCRTAVSMRSIKIMPSLYVPAGRTSCSPVGMNTNGDRAFVIVDVQSTYYLFDFALTQSGWSCSSRNLIIVLH